MKRLVAFMRVDCPICFRLSAYLTDFALTTGTSVEKVYIDTVGDSSLVGRYRFFIDSVFGGEEHVPVLLLGESRWFVPKRTTTRSGEAITVEEVDASCREVMRRVAESLNLREEVFPETHEQMKGVRKWAPNMFLSRVVATT